MAKRLKKPRSSLLGTLNDLTDVVRHARSGGEIVRGLMPSGMLKRKILNEGEAPATDAGGIDQALRRLRNQLKGEFLDEGAVDYAGIKASPVYRELQETSRLLPHVHPTEFSQSERLAFWLNLYNVLAIHGIIALEIRKSVMEVPSFFHLVAYRVSDWVFTLDDIENGVLRRNRPHPAMKNLMFDADDPRMACCPREVDPRIHMALVCCAASCPPVAFYEAGQIDAQLEAATRNFVESEILIDEKKRELTLPLIFRYYEEDFGGWQGVGEFMLEHSEGEQHERIARAITDGYAARYQRYDWSLNHVI